MMGYAGSQALLGYYLTYILYGYIVADMGTIQKTVTFYVCERCDHEWYPRKEGKPTVCPSCKSPYWDKPRQNQSK
jgi:DNA-directed RNA polymerase subunit RPC12/RpoP